MKKIFGNSLIRLLLAIALGIITGVILAKTFGNEKALIAETYLSPVLNIFVIIITRLALVIMFFSVITSMLENREDDGSGKTGRKLFWVFIAVITISAFFAVVFGNMFFGLESATGSQSSVAKIDADSGLVDFLIGIIPVNPIMSFVNGNSLQVLLMAFVAGLVVTLLRKKLVKLCRALFKINDFLLKVLKVFSYILPVYVFISIINAIFLEKLKDYAGIWKLIIFFVIGSLIISGIITAIVSIKLKKPVLQIIRSVLPAFVIAISTSTSMLAYDEMLKTCSENLGLSKESAKFAVPLGLILCKPAASFFLAGICCFFAEIYAIPVSPIWLFTAAFIATLLCITVAPAPAAGLGCYAVLFTQLGIPGDALALALSSDSFFEFAITGINVYNQPLSASIAVGQRE